jgi:hypothetical protein
MPRGDSANSLASILKWASILRRLTLLTEREGAFLWAGLDITYALACEFFAQGWRRGFCGVQLPDDLAHYGGPHVGVAAFEI